MSATPERGVQRLHKWHWQSGEVTLKAIWDCTSPHLLKISQKHSALLTSQAELTSIIKNEVYFSLLCNFLFLGFLFHFRVNWKKKAVFQKKDTKQTYIAFYVQYCFYCLWNKPTVASTVEHNPSIIIHQKASIIFKIEAIQRNHKFKRFCKCRPCFCCGSNVSEEHILSFLGSPPKHICRFFSNGERNWTTKAQIYLKWYI